MDTAPATGLDHVEVIIEITGTLPPVQVHADVPLAILDNPAYFIGSTPTLLGVGWVRRHGVTTPPAHTSPASTARTVLIDGKKPESPTPLAVEIAAAEANLEAWADHVAAEAEAGFPVEEGWSTVLVAQVRTLIDSVRAALPEVG